MTVMLATFMEVLDTTVVNVSLPNIAAIFRGHHNHLGADLLSGLERHHSAHGGWFSMLFGANGSS